MSTHIHTSNGREWLMVEVPEDGALSPYEMVVSFGGLLPTQVVMQEHNTVVPEKYADSYNDMPDEILEQNRAIALGCELWRIHSDSLTITEEQAGEIVEKDESGWYKGYEQSGDYQMLSSTSAVRSYRSLLRSLTINSRVINLVRQ